MHICSFCLYGVYLYLISLSPSCLYSNSPPSPSSLNSYCQSSHSRQAGDSFSSPKPPTQGLTDLPWLRFDASQRCAASPY